MTASAAARPEDDAAQHRRWRRPPSILLALMLAPVSLALGYAGYRASDLELSRSDALYAALQLFTVGGVIPESDTPLQLEIARFLAPVAVVYAAVVAALGLLRNHAQRLLVAFRSGHVVVVGLGATGKEVALGLEREGHDVVALERSQGPRVSAARAEGVRVVLGDGTTPTHLRRVRIHRASDVVVLTGDDSRNLEVASLVRAVLCRRAEARATVHVAIADLELWRELDQVRLSLETRGVVTEYVHLAERTGQRVVDRVLTLLAHDRSAPVLVDGDTPVAARVVAGLLRRALSEDRRPALLLPADSALPSRLDQDEPWWREHVDLQTGEQGLTPVVVVVCAPEDADSAAISRALRLARRHPTAQVVATVYRPRSESTLDAAGRLRRRVHLISAKVDALGRELLSRSATELMAEARHEHYVAQQTAKGDTAATNPSLVPWPDLPEPLKESNRSFARHVAAAVGQLGAQVVPLTGPPSTASLPVSPVLLEELARAEKQRWNDDMHSKGWTYAAGPKDPRAKTHPSLVPWESLTESERDKDRDAYRALPRMLGKIGYALEFPSRPTQGSGPSSLNA